MRRGGAHGFTKGEDMATSDGESCSAEDRAFDEWAQSPWGDGPDAVPAALARIETQTAVRVDIAFRAGFRAGQENPKLGTLGQAAMYEQLKGHDRAAELLKRLESLEQRADKVDAQIVDIYEASAKTSNLVRPAGSRIARGEGDTLPGLVGRVEALEAKPDYATWRSSVETRLKSVLANMHDLRGAGVLGRLVAIEAKLRLLEPIG